MDNNKNPYVAKEHAGIGKASLPTPKNDSAKSIPSNNSVLPSQFSVELNQVAKPSINSYLHSFSAQNSPARVVLNTRTGLRENEYQKQPETNLPQLNKLKP
ncbi:MAG: hypothetical protein WCP97_07660 [bacterium]